MNLITTKKVSEHYTNKYMPKATKDIIAPKVFCKQRSTNCFADSASSNYNAIQLYNNAWLGCFTLLSEHRDFKITFNIIYCIAIVRVTMLIYPKCFN